MAIDLPPALPPLPAKAETIQTARAAARGVVQATAGRFTVEVVGPSLLNRRQIQSALRAAEEPNTVILALTDAYHRAGHLLVSLHYALVGNKLSVFVIQGELAGIVAPPALEKFFDSLLGDSDLTVSEFDRRRLMADIKADRAGEAVGISYRAEDPTKVTMVMTATPVENFDETEFSFQIGNPGNRFIGRYFQQSTIRHKTNYGTEFVIGYESALVDLGEVPRGGKRFDNLQVAFDQPTVYGLYGMDVSHTRYAVEAAVTDADSNNAAVVAEFVDFEAEISEVGLNGRQVWLSSPTNRLNTYQRLEHIESEFFRTSPLNPTPTASLDRLANNANSVQHDEPHSTVELGVSWYHLRLNSGTTYTFDFAVEAGVSSNGGTLQAPGDATDARNQPPVAGGIEARNRTNEFVILRPKFGVSTPVFGDGSLSFDLIGQIADSRLPQQQQWVLGGLSGVSAYLPGVLVGDTGYYALAQASSATWEVLGMRLRASVFAELGTSEFEDAVGNASDMLTIVDAGLRIEADLGWDVRLELVAATSIDEKNFDSFYGNQANADAVLDSFEADFFFTLRKTF